MAAVVTRSLLVPMAAILVFLMLWTAGAKQVQTSLGELPGPAKVWEQGMVLLDEHRAERSARRVRRAHGRAGREGHRRGAAAGADRAHAGAPVHRAADLRRPDLHQPADRDDGLPDRDGDRDPARVSRSA
jgi:hypothetical protein